MNAEPPVRRGTWLWAKGFAKGAVQQRQALHGQVASLQQEVSHLHTLLQQQQKREAHRIEHYRPVHLIGFDPDSDRPHLALRSFYKGGALHFWAVDVQNLQTKILPQSRFEVRLRVPKQDGSRYLDAGVVESSSYATLLRETTKQGQPRENAGLTRCDGTPTGVMLTVDLCPSQRPYEVRLFDALKTRATEKQAPIPLALCVSGLWVKAHEELLDEWASQECKALFDITWVNHSLGHAYHPDKPFAENFLLYPGTHWEAEIFETEKMLIQKDLCPSIFYRLPGLVGDDKLLATFRSLGLIPLGADAWLAKGQVPKAGSIVLTHGNGNEPRGIELALPLVSGPDALKFISLTGEARRHAETLDGTRA